MFLSIKDREFLKRVQDLIALPRALSLSLVLFSSPVTFVEYVNGIFRVLDIHNYVFKYHFSLVISSIILCF